LPGESAAARSAIERAVLIKPRSRAALGCGRFDWIEFVAARRLCRRRAIKDKVVE